MIECVKEEELEEIHDFINYCIWITYHEYFPEASREDLSYSMDQLLQVYDQMQLFMLKNKGRIIGTIALDRTSNTKGQLFLVYVHPDFQRKGIGSTLVSYVENIAKEMGLKSIFLFTIEKAKWAIKFYENLGYRITHKKEQEWGIDVFLEKEL